MATKTAEEYFDPKFVVTRTISSIKKNIENARSHLSYHVTEEGRVISLDKKCEYCQIYMQE